MAKPKFDINNLVAYRKSQGLNQLDFWSGVGVTQSAGSRYESGRPLPLPVAILLTLRETGKITSAQIKSAADQIKKTKK